MPDPAEPFIRIRGLTQSFRPMLGEFLPHLDAQGGNRQIVEAGWQRQLFVMGGAGHLLALAVDVARILGGDVDLLDHCFT